MTKMGLSGVFSHGVVVLGRGLGIFIAFPRARKTLSFFAWCQAIYKIFLSPVPYARVNRHCGLPHLYSAQRNAGRNFHTGHWSDQEIYARNELC